MPKKAGNEYGARAKSKSGQGPKKVHSWGTPRTLLAVRGLLCQPGDPIYLRGQGTLGDEHTDTASNNTDANINGYSIWSLK